MVRIRKNFVSNLEHQEEGEREVVKVLLDILTEKELECHYRVC